MPFPLALAALAGSQILSGFAQSQANKSAANAARLNALAARISTMFKVQDLEDAGRRLESAQRAAYAKSGVDISTGSAAEVTAESARQIEREIYRVKYTGGLQEQGAMTQADAFTKAADFAMIGGFMKGGAVALAGKSKLDESKVAPNTDTQVGTWP